MRTPAESLDLRDLVVAVTGASGGIGAGIARRFAAAGASLVLHHRRDPAPSELGSGLDVPLATVRADLTSPTGPDRLVAAAVDTFGRLDVLVNNAGVQPLAALVDVDVGAWADMMDVNVTAVHRCTQAFARHRIGTGGGGSVVIISSIEGIQPAPAHGHYATSKAAVRMYARSAAQELGVHGIRVNVVSPGLIDRPGLTDDWPEGVERWLRAVPLSRLGHPEDIGDACVFLASPMARFMTGAELVVDGGVLTLPTW